jgi:hypothetical protein
MQYAKMPLEFLRDSRLSKNDFRVLGVLIYRSNSDGKCWPSRGDISTLSGLPKTRVNEVVKRLSNLGFLKIKYISVSSSKILRKEYQIDYTKCNSMITQSVTPKKKDDYTKCNSMITQSVTPIPITFFKHKIVTEKKVVSAKRISVFSFEDILSVEIPTILAEEKGFDLAWKKWVKTKAGQKRKKDCFEKAEQVENVLGNLEKWFLEGLDIVEGLETAADREWIGFRKGYFEMSGIIRKPKLSKSEQINKAFANLKNKTDGNNTKGNDGSDENIVGDLSEYGSDGIHSESVGTGTKRLLS